MNGQIIGQVAITRRQPDGKPLRREPEPVLDAAAKAAYAGRPMFNDVYSYDWRVSFRGNVTSNTGEAPLEHRYGDGALALLHTVLGQVVDTDD